LYFSALLALSGIGIGIFKTGALALIGDLAKSTKEHTSLMNTVEGFFGVGSIIGPAILARLLNTGASWKGLYLMAGTVCVVLILTALQARYPHTIQASRESMDLKHTVAAVKNRYALAFSLGAFLYVATEAAVYVWMPRHINSLNTNPLPRKVPTGVPEAMASQATERATAGGPKSASTLR
jgi:fucose permease